MLLLDTNVITRNVADFQIPGIKLLNPWGNGP